MKCTLSGKRGCNSTTGLVDSLRTCAFFASMVSTPSVSTFEMLPSTVDYYSLLFASVRNFARRRSGWRYR